MPAMHALLISAGSRGDFQPMLALAVALRAAGHDVTLTAGASFAPEAAAFGVPFEIVGMDTKEWMDENAKRLSFTPLNAAFELLKLVRTEFQVQLDGALPLARGADIVIGGGAMLAAPTVAQAAGVPLRYLAFTPQVFRSRHHAPFILQFTDLPPLVNRALWMASRILTEKILRAAVNPTRAALGLSYVDDLQAHVFPVGEAIVAADPELCPVAPDLALQVAPVGSFELPDDRPLPADLEAFLRAGPAPVYLGFGSMPDKDPSRTTRLLIDAVRSSRVRAILSRGWAGFDAENDRDLFVAGPLSHRALFPRCAAIVHHGGAGTTHAAARAGVPQIVVPHAFDQFQFSAWVERAGIGTPRLPRTKLGWQALSDRIDRATTDRAMQSRAAALGERMRARNPLRDTIAILERIVDVPKRARG